MLRHVAGPFCCCLSHCAVAAPVLLHAPSHCLTIPLPPLYSRLRAKLEAALRAAEAAASAAEGRVAAAEGERDLLRAELAVIAAQVGLAFRQGLGFCAPK
jgi:hypothetical protein